MNTKVLCVQAGYTLWDLYTDFPWLAIEMEFLGLDFRDQTAVSSQRQFVRLMQKAADECNLLIVIDGSDDFYSRDIIAQGFHKPLEQNPAAARTIQAYLSKMGRGPNEAALSYAQIPAGSIPLLCPDSVEQGFVLLYPSICIAVVPSNKKVLRSVFAEKLYPLLLKSMNEGSYTVTIPLKPERASDVQAYIDQTCRHARGFLPLVCRERQGADLRLTAIRPTTGESSQCCDSFLEDLTSELGNVTKMSRIGRKGSRAAKSNRTPSGGEEAFFPAPPEGEPIDPYDLLVDQQEANASAYPYEDRRAKKEAKRMAKKAAKANRSLFDKVRSFLLFLFICIFVGCLGYLGWYYYKSAQNRANYETLREVYDSPGLTPSGYPSDYDKEFAGLWSINNDTVGWINIPDTGLDYPVVQADDNETYYRKNFEGAYSEHAVPFVDYHADLKAPSKNLVIYGHNIRADGQMFNILRNYRDIEYLKAHPVIEFNSVYHRNKYKIFSIFYSNTLPEHGPVFSYHEFINGGQAEAQQYIRDVTLRSIYNTGVDVLPSDEFLTLSTCTYEFKDARYVVVARKIRDGESESVDASLMAKNPNPLYPDIWYSLFGGTKPSGGGSAAVSSPSAPEPSNNQETAPADTSSETTPPETPPASGEPQQSQSPEKDTPEQAPSDEPSTEEPSETPVEESAEEPDAAPAETEEDPQPSEEEDKPVKKIIKKKSSSEEDSASADAEGAEEAASLSGTTETITQSFYLSTAFAGGTVTRESSDDDTSSSKDVEKSIRKVYSASGDLTERSETDGDVPAESETAAKKVIKPKSSSSSSDSSSSSSSSTSSGSDSRPSVSSPSSTKSVSKLKIKSNGVSKTGTPSEILAGVVEAEMGASFQMEALKAQAVAAYSYICYNNASGIVPSLPYKTPSSKVKSAVQAVLGEAVYYNGNFANTTYYASSAGVTNDSRNVWGGSLPYLVSVSSPGDTKVKAYGATKTFSVDTVASRIRSYLKVDPYDYGDPEDWFSDITYYCGKYIDTIRVCGKKINGRDVRESLLKSQINSAAFEIDCDGRNFTFTTYGYGHGVGMSQQGADYYASQGWDYQEILTHYYPHTQVG